MYYFVDKTVLIPNIIEYTEEYDALNKLYNSLETKDIYVVYKNNEFEHNVYIKKNNKIYKYNENKYGSEVIYNFIKQINYSVDEIYNLDNKNKIINKNEMIIEFNENNDHKIIINEYKQNNEKDEKEELRKQLKEQMDELEKIYKNELEKHKNLERKVKNKEKKEIEEKIKHICLLRDDYKTYKALKRDNIADVPIFFVGKYKVLEDYDKELKNKLDEIVDIDFEIQDNLEEKYIIIGENYYNIVKNIKYKLDHSYQDLEEEVD